MYFISRNYGRPRDVLSVNFRPRTHRGNSNDTMHLYIPDEIQSVHGSLQNPRKHVFSVLPINKTRRADLPCYSFVLKSQMGNAELTGGYKECAWLDAKMKRDLNIATPVRIFRVRWFLL